MRPIPKKLLIHSVTYGKESTSDRFGDDKEIVGKVLLRNVRLEPSSKVIRDKNNAELQLSAMMFYDCKNSRPSGMKFRTDDIIIFNGVNHRIETVEPLYDDKRIHHWELGLVRCG